jgi:hypothetical protein
MRYCRLALTCVATLGLAASASAKESPAPPAAALSPDAALLPTTIGYTLPSTTLAVSIDLTLKNCARGRFEVTPDIKISSTAGPEPHPEYRFRLDAADLQSFTRDKSLGVELYPNGALKSVNGGVTDQTGSIITSILKAIISIAAVADAPKDADVAGTCNGAVTAALGRIDAYGLRIKALREKLDSPDVEVMRKARDQIDILAAEIARLRTTLLHITIPAREIVPQKGLAAYRLNITRGAIAAWLIDPRAPSDNDAIVRELDLGVCLASEAGLQGDVQSCDKEVVTDAINTARSHAGSSGLMPIEALACPDGAECRRTIVLREPVPTRVSVIAEGAGYGVKPNKALAQAKLSISQWGSLSYIPLKVGFGKSVTFALGFDENGRKISQSWAYKARGSGIAGAASGIADAGATLYGSLDGRQLAADKAEVDRLTTLKNLNQLRACREYLDAGGFKCPGE